MRDIRAMNVLPFLLLTGALSLPAPASAFWSGPGCFLANMLGGGGLSGGFGFSAGARGSVYGYPYGAPPLYGAPYPFDPGAPLMSPALPPRAGEAPQRPAEFLQANRWSHTALTQPEAAEAQRAVEPPAPRNRWRP